MNDIKAKEEKIQLSLRKAISDALENKRRLGQYAVVAEDGKPKRIDPAQQVQRGTDAAAEKAD